MIKPYFQDSLQTYTALNKGTDSLNAFGMVMPERSFSNEKYRYGMNTQEKVDEIAGAGNHTTALFWEYDTRLGRRWNVDPMPRIWESTYSVFGDNPNSRTDILGNKWKDEHSKKVGDRLIGKLDQKINTAKKEYNKNLETAQKLADIGNSEGFDNAMDELEESAKKIRSLTASKKELLIMGDENTAQIFGFEKIQGSVGGTYKNKDSEIVMEYNSDINAIHESTHGYQQYIGEAKKAATTETIAYTRQYFFTSGETDINGDVIDFSKSVRSPILVKHSRDITAKWLWNLPFKNDQGKPLYPVDDYPDIYFKRLNGDD